MSSPCAGPLSVLRNLHARGWTDPEIADGLSEKFLPLSWSTRQVFYWRHKLGLACKPHPKKKRPETHLREGREAYLAMHQVDCGLAHLLPYYDRNAKRWREGYALSPRQADVLALLLERGPLTRPEVAALLGVRRPAAAGRDLLASLVRLGLARRAGRRGGRRGGLRVYAAAEIAPNGVPLARGKRLETGVERRAARTEESGE